jgi:hypothetical protein
MRALRIRGVFIDESNVLTAQYMNESSVYMDGSYSGVYSIWLRGVYTVYEPHVYGLE